MNPNTVIAARSGHRREFLLKRIRESDNKLLPTDLDQVRDALSQLQTRHLLDDEPQAK